MIGILSWTGLQFYRTAPAQTWGAPEYAELVKAPEGLAFAKEAFEKAKPRHHPITTASVQDLLDKASAGQ